MDIAYRDLGPKLTPPYARLKQKVKVRAGRKRIIFIHAPVITTLIFINLALSRRQSNLDREEIQHNHD